MTMKQPVKEILFITLSNIGDVILTFPALDSVMQSFPEAKISVLASTKTKDLFLANDRIKTVFVYEKGLTFWQKIRWFTQLRRYRFDMVIDMKNSIVPVFLGAKYRTPLMRRRQDGQHMRDYHLTQVFRMGHVSRADKKQSFAFSDKEEKSVTEKLSPFIQGSEKYVVILPGAADHRKRWTEEGFATTADALVQECGYKVVFAGDEKDAPIASRIKARMRMTALDLSAQLNLIELGVLLQKAVLCLTNDSGPMHLASYLDVPIVAMFGPTNPSSYGPWSRCCAFLRRTDGCLGCQQGGADPEHTCLESIKTQEAIDMISKILNLKHMDLESAGKV